MSSRVRLVYIASLSHSGSTLLELLLNAHSRFVSVGELKKFQPHILDGDRFPCTCGEKPLEGCGFWRPIAERLGRDGWTLDQLRTDRIGSDLVGCNQALLNTISEQSGGAIIVDSSKIVRRLEGLLTLPDVDILPVVLLRDPRGQIHSTLRKGEATLQEAIRMYNRTNRRIMETVRGRPHLLVHYEQLVRDPEGAIAPILAHFGERFEPSQLTWATAPKHSLAGNRMRHGTDSTIRADESWKTGLNLWQQLAIQVGTALTRGRIAQS